MIKVLTERKIPPGFDTSDDAQVARHVRIAVDAMAALPGGPAHWLCTYVTEDSLFGVAVFEDEASVAAFQAAAGISGQQITARIVRRTLDPSLAAPRPA
jgi:hypothetical protein